MSDESAIHAAVVAGTALAAERVKWSKQGTAQPPSGPGAWVSLHDLGDSPIGIPAARWERNPYTFADKPITAVAAGAPGTLTVPAHGLAAGDGPVRLTTGGVAPAGTATGTDYWVIPVAADTLRLATSFLRAVDTPTPIAITDAGIGVHALVATAQTLKAGAEAKATVRGVERRTISVQCFGGAAIGDASPSSILRRLRAALALPNVRGALNAGGVALQSAGAVRDVSVRVSASVFEPRAVMELVVVVRAPELTATETIIETATTTVTLTA